MTPSYYKQYIALEKCINVDVDPWTFYTGLRMGANAIRESLKADYAIKIIERRPKTVVYSAFKSKGVDLFEEALNQGEIPYLKFTGETKAKDRQKIVEEFNADPTYKVLLITNAGSLGLDLKGVRDLILFESMWNQEEEKQVIGRAVRYDSHAHLPPEDRNVTVHRLLLIKPKSKKLFQLHPSANEILEELSQSKQKQTRHLLDRLKEFAIERNERCFF
jgi:SNF2 family DNA or RNA helicase